MNAKNNIINVPLEVFQKKTHKSSPNVSHVTVFQQEPTVLCSHMGTMDTQEKIYEDIAKAILLEEIVDELIDLRNSIDNHLDNL